MVYRNKKGLQLRADCGLKRGIFRGLHSGATDILRWALRYNDLSICPMPGNHNSKAL